jgi:Tfp pilus assembly protein PilV
MRTAVARLRRRCAGTAPDDAGLSLVEVLAAMTLFVIVSAAMLSALTVGFGMSKSNRDRVVAANLAASDLDDVRSQAQTPAGYDTVREASYTKSIGGATYTVRRTVRAQLLDTTSGPCTGGTGLREAYRRVTVLVDWANRRFSDPVRTDTILRTPAIDAVSGNGAVGVVVTDQATGLGLPGITATVNGTSLTTDDDGCAYFVPVPARSAPYDVAITAPGYVSASGLTQTAGVASDVITRVTFAIARTARINVTGFRATGAGGAALGAAYTIPGELAGRGATFRSTDGSVPARTVTPLPSVSDVFPTTYAVWAGQCTAGDGFGAGSFTGVTATPGSTQNVVVPLAGLEVSPSTTTSGWPSKTTTRSWKGSTLTFTRVADTAKGCTAGAVLTVPTPSSGTAPVKVALPYGSWTVKSVSRSGNNTVTNTGSPNPVALGPNAAPATATVTP